MGATSAPKSTITLFTPQFAQFNTHPKVTLNNSILSLERTACILGVTFGPHLKLNAHVKSLVPLWYQLRSVKGNYTYHLYVPYSVPFHVCSSHLVTQHLTIPYSVIPNYPKLCPPHSHCLR